MAQRPETAPLLMLACAVLTLSGVSLLAPRQPVQAAPPPVAQPSTAPTSAAPKIVEYDDGDGDELLEHWGDPKYAREERWQMAGIGVGFLALTGLTRRKRIRQPARQVELTLVDVSSQKKAA